MSTATKRTADQAEAESATDPPNLTYKSADLLSSKEQFIIHQCNCITSTPAGLASQITKQFPYAAPYSSRVPSPTHPSRCIDADKALPGTIQVWPSPDGEKGPSFVGLFAQYGPGKPGKDDTKGQREEWFKTCLDKVGELKESEKGVRSVALPWGIGCGLAGGDWVVYEGIIKEWAKKNEDVEVAVYKLEGVELGKGEDEDV